MRARLLCCCRNHTANCWVLLTSSLSVLAGTFITEWKAGGQLCEAFLAGDERSYRAVADQLVLIAQFFRFDGWLINIENSLSVSIAFSWCLPSPVTARCPSVTFLGSPWPVRASPDTCVTLPRDRIFSGAVSRNLGWLSFALLLLQGAPFLLLHPLCLGCSCGFPWHHPPLSWRFIFSSLLRPCPSCFRKKGQLGPLGGSVG